MSTQLQDIVDACKILDCIERIPPAQLRDMLLCTIQRVHDIATGKPYFDYEAQQWRNG